MNDKQRTNLQRFKKNLPASAGETRIYDLPNGGKVFQGDFMSIVQNARLEQTSYENATRSQLLESLLACDGNLEKILLALNELEWDSEESLIILNRQHIIAILNRYLNTEISSVDIENWANAIECREDISYEENFKTAIDRIIQELANPLLYQPLSNDIAREWRDRFVALDNVDIYREVSEH